MRMSYKVITAFSALLLMASFTASALEAPQGNVILTVGGNISQSNVDGEAHFDRQMLEALEQHTLTTATPWTEGVSTFEGPLGRALLDAVGAQGTTLKVIAINDYSAEVPVSDLQQLPVILAMKADGVNLRVRDKGPLFVIYPFDDDASLATEVYYGRSVWQIKRIEVE